MFYRGYLESFSTALKSSKIFNNITPKMEIINDKIESNSFCDVKEKNYSTNESHSEIMHEV